MNGLSYTAESPEAQAALEFALAVRALPMKLRIELRTRQRAGEDGEALLREMQLRELV